MKHATNQPTPRLGRTSGFTVFELTFSVALFALLTTVFAYTLLHASEEVHAGVWETDLSSSTRRVMQRLTTEISASGQARDGTNYLTSHPPDATTITSSVTFHRRIGFAGDATDWSPEITYALTDSPGEDPTNGIDDDGDGAIDERGLSRTQGGSTTLIVEGMTRFVVTRNNGSNLVTIDLTLARPDRIGRPATERQAMVTFRLRNSTR